MKQRQRFSLYPCCSSVPCLAKLAVSVVADHIHTVSIDTGYGQRGVNKFKRNFSYMGLAVLLFCSCNLDYAPSMILTSIADSKERGFFLFEYKMDSVIIFDKKKSFIVKKAWIERVHTSTMSKLGKETFQTDSDLNQIVFDLDQHSYINSRNFNNWIMSDEKGHLGCFLEGRMISYGLNFKETQERIRLKVYSLQIPGDFNHDTIKVVEFILNKR